MNKIDAFPDLYWQASDGDELRKLVGSLADMTEAEYLEWLEGAEVAVKVAFTAIGKEKIRGFVD
jgi:hypothetical protein